MIFDFSRSPILKLWSYIEPSRKAQLFKLLILMILSSFSEVLSIGAVLPFLGVLINPEKLLANDLVSKFFAHLGICNTGQAMLFITIIFVSLVMVAGLLRLYLIKEQTKIAFSIGSEISATAFMNTLYQPYFVHVSRNSSEVISAIINKTHSVIFSTLIPILVISSSSLILLTIIMTLFFINPNVAIIAFGGFATLYSLVLFFTKKRLKVDSQRISSESNQVIKALQEGLGGIRDVLIDNTQPYYCNLYAMSDQKLRRSQSSIHFISTSPRYLIEALGVTLIAVIAFFMSERESGLTNSLPVLGALALGAQRLLPVMQQLYGGITSVRSGTNSLVDVLKLLDHPPQNYLNKSSCEAIEFTSEIILKGVCFRYTQDSPNILNNINLTIKRGWRVGFIGNTGCGKSTLLDIIMGLLQPNSGKFLVDGLPITALNSGSWKNHIAHVPQSIFLADSTIAENIAFGVPLNQIDYDKVRRAARQAQISETIESWQMQYETLVGERGVRLSGGQRQRIGIARALYKEADVIVFDEATSALDTDTEHEVMEAINRIGHDKTILIVAHRLSTLEKCDFIVKLKNGHVIKVGRYSEVLNAN